MARTRSLLSTCSTVPVVSLKTTLGILVWRARTHTHTQTKTQNKKEMTDAQKRRDKAHHIQPLPLFFSFSRVTRAQQEHNKSNSTHATLIPLPTPHTTLYPYPFNNQLGQLHIVVLVNMHHLHVVVLSTCTTYTLLTCQHAPPSALSLPHPHPLFQHNPMFYLNSSVMLYSTTHPLLELQHHVVIRWQPHACPKHVLQHGALFSQSVDHRGALRDQGGLGEVGQQHCHWVEAVKGGFTILAQLCESDLGGMCDLGEMCDERNV